MMNPACVMVIEDHNALREATIEILHQAGFDALGIECAEDLVDAHAARTYDAYIIDLNLPGEDGYSLAARIRDAQPQSNIIITTARTNVSDRVKGYTIGADIYMSKPVEPTELVAALRSLIARNTANHARAGRATLIREQSLLAGPADSVTIAESEVQLLVTFALAKEKTLERWQILSQLSEDDDISNDNLQNRLSQLRKKIARCGIEGKSIKAVRGVGYRLCIDLIIN